MTVLLTGLWLAVALLAIIAIYCGWRVKRMKALLTALSLAGALVGAGLGLQFFFWNDSPLTRVWAAVFTGFLLLSGYFHRNAIRHLGAWRALLHLTSYLGVLLVLLPGGVMAIFAGGDLPMPLALIVFDAWELLSYYYALPAAVFGGKLFLTGLVVIPHGYPGIFAGALVFAMVSLLAACMLHVVVRSLGVLARMPGN